MQTTRPIGMHPTKRNDAVDFTTSTGSHMIRHRLLELFADAWAGAWIAAWDRLDTDQRQSLLRDLESLDHAELRLLFERRHEKADLPPIEASVPCPARSRIGTSNSGFANAAWRRFEAARSRSSSSPAVRSRLGFEHPKGMYPIGPSLANRCFQIHAEKFLALSRRFPHQFLLLWMTSAVTHDETVAYFRQHRYFGLFA